jgi:hypothetical protein
MLLAKFYNVIPFPINFFRDRMQNPNQLWADEQSKIYRIGKNTHDTFTEAAGCRCLLEKRYSAVLESDPDFRLHLVVVTSAYHEERARWIFNNVFADAAWISISFDSSATTRIEAETRVAGEPALFERQQKAIEPYGNAVAFLNAKRKADGVKYVFEFRERTLAQAVVHRSVYQVFITSGEP